jgi:peptidoglycan/LPS O-acetylase OafA/YrhL
MSLAEREDMKEIVGMNLICYAIAFILLFISDMETKDKLLGMLATVVFMGTLSAGVYLLAGA